MHNDFLQSDPRMRTRSRQHRAQSRRSPGRATPWGQVVVGPAFYVWEEDPQEARQWGAELAAAWVDAQRDSDS